MIATNYCVVVSYQDKMRNFHRAAFLEDEVAVLDRVVAKAVARAEGMSKSFDHDVARQRMLEARHAGDEVAVAKASGFTGNACTNPQCGSFNVRRTGTCETCQDCGNNAGCG
jgi:hypothetical protein